MKSCKSYFKGGEKKKENQQKNRTTDSNESQVKWKLQ